MHSFLALFRRASVPRRFFLYRRPKMWSQVHLLFFMIEFLTLSNCKNNLQFPPFSPIEVEGAVVWKCHYQDTNKVNFQELLSQSGSELLHTHEDSITVLSSSLQKDGLRAFNLHPCHQVANISQLIDVEWEQNFNPWRGQPGQNWNGMKSGKNRGRVLRSAIAPDVNSGSLSYNFDHYKNYSALVEWYEALAEQHPSLMTIVSIGKSYYGRDILALKFTSRNGGPRRRITTEKPIVYIQCLLHAREWITGPVCMYIARQLTGKESRLLDKVEVVMVPIANPDGYHLTWYRYPKYRLWRKNLEPFPGTKCAGVDLNRNFDTHWNDNLDEFAKNKCSTVHRGPAPASSLEVQALTSFIESLGQRAVGFLDVHSYHQKILYPPAWKDSNPKDIAVLRSVAEAMTGAMTKVGEVYTPMRMVDIYSASGTFADWLIDYRDSASGCPSLVPITIELRPSAAVVDMNAATTGFLLPTQEILPTCTETLAGFKEFVKETLRTGRDCLEEKLPK